MLGLTATTGVISPDMRDNMQGIHAINFMESSMLFFMIQRCR